MSLRDDAIKELARRELEKRHAPERESLIRFIEYFYEKELNRKWETNWHHYLIEEKLQKVLRGEITRLIINIPPGSAKTTLVSQFLPIFAMGHNPQYQIIATGYSATLAQNFGAQARDYYRSKIYQEIFPRRSPIKDDMDTKGLWRNIQGGQYLSAGAGAGITGNRANLIVIDDPIKPDEALSDVMREGVNRWYDNTILSRLYNPNKDAVVIVMQRTHENDLCGYLLDKMKKGTGEQWDLLQIKGIAEVDEEHRKQGESWHESRMPLTALEKIRINNPAVFSTQYQQEPQTKESQEFHEEFFRYYQELPKTPSGNFLPLRKFIAVDPAFKQKQQNDETSIVAGGFDGDKLYILEIIHGRFDPSATIEKIIYLAKKWQVEKVGIEAYAAQTVLGHFLKEKMRQASYLVPVDEIIQTGDKESKIRKLIAPIQYGNILWKPEMQELEQQLIRFPRGKHDDVCDSVQMLYSIYQPRAGTTDYERPHFEYDQLGRPVFR